MTRAMKQLFLTYHIDKSTSRSEFLNDLHLRPEIHDSTSEPIQETTPTSDDERFSVDALVSQNYRMVNEYSLEPTPKPTPKPTPEDLRQSYEILEIKETSTKVEIEEAYKNKKEFYHPDKFLNDFASRIAWAEEKTKKIIEAYKKLKDAGKVD